MEWLVYAVLLVIAFFAMEAGYTFFAFLIFVGMILLLSAKTQPKHVSHAVAHHEAEKPIVIEAGHGDLDSGPGRMGRMNYVMVSHKKNIEYQDYFNANFGLTFHNIGKGIFDLLSPPLQKPKKDEGKDKDKGGGH